MRDEQKGEAFMKSGIEKRRKKVTAARGTKPQNDSHSFHLCHSIIRVQKNMHLYHYIDDLGEDVC